MVRTPRLSPRFRSTTLFLLAIAVSSFGARASRASELYVGGSTVSITPNQPVPLAGQMRTRISQEARTEITATALAIETRDGDQVIDQAVMVSCDLAVIRGGLLDKVRERLQDEMPGFDLDKIFISATHTHTAPVVLEGNYHLPEEGIMFPREYFAYLLEQVSQAVKDAWNSRQPAQVGWGLGHAVVAYNRRSVYADGHAAMYGSTTVPEFRGIEGYEDHGVEVLFFWNPQDELIATAINVACPAQEVEGDSSIDADFWHPVRETLREKYGNELLVLGWIGAAGDQSPHLRFRKQAEDRMRELRGLTRLEEISARIVQAWETAYTGAKQEKHTNVPFIHQVHTFQLPRREVTRQEYDETKAVVAKMLQDPVQHRAMVWNRDVLDRYERQQAGTVEPFLAEVHTIRLGDVAIATNEFELFTQFGIQMKARCKALQTFVVQLAGAGTYIPTPQAAAGGGYSAVAASNEVGHEGGQVLTDETIAALNSLWPDN
ncbi:MAG: hypothetical protein KDA57_07050 [Planctomycetales bacterium]|nr:hypothetical protein [Planctomycetales bacterium]